MLHYKSELKISIKILFGIIIKLGIILNSQGLLNLFILILNGKKRKTYNLYS